ncbi:MULTISPECIES: CoA pyrophosphatase [Pseudomonadati]|uniref:CoA pyrophosphatase n=1 Tax=Shewanella aestuarii TaxID=1028752 RepID=A0ABT0KX01_9GAMM|nr:CoA pyrophosphatase [Shewanella aestuarii]MCL1115991.1 CoA pyrophosphatase [Shewanella aestuarii]GGN69875.1 coenzyme A pyrophosphatase [Shewanella aestuarii]
MQLNDFLIRFQLQPLSVSNISSAPAHFPGREAAVLIPIEQIDGQLYLLLTKRPLHLRHHPGQISFPGGKLEDNDKNATDTALREAEEEIGLQRGNVTVIGAFPPHKTFTGFTITPIIGIINQPFDLIIDPGEVDSCFKVPLNYFKQGENRHLGQHWRKGKLYQVHYMPFEDKFIWGVTAAIIDLLCRHIDN